MIQPRSAPRQLLSSVMLSVSTLAAILLVVLAFFIGLAYRRRHPSYNDNASDRAWRRERNRYPGFHSGDG
jgi:hypothetical protein